MINYKLFVIRQVKNDIELQYTFEIDGNINDKSWVIGFDKDFLDEASRYDGDLGEYIFESISNKRVHIVKKFGRKKNEHDYIIMFVVYEVIKYYKENNEVLKQLYKIDKDLYEQAMK